MQSLPARVLVLEHDDAYRARLEEAFRSDGWSVRQESHGHRFTPVVGEFRPDVAVVQAFLASGPDAHTLVRRVRATSDVPLILFAARVSPAERLAAFEAGCDDYVLEPFVAEELVARARALLRRSGRLPGSTVRVGDLEIDEARATVTRKGVAVPLRKTEYRVLTLLARHRGQVLSKHQLLDKVWGFEALDPNRVEAQVSGLRRKLELHGPRLIHTIRGFGYVLRD